MNSVETEAGDILVIGFGNALRHDDGLGIAAIAELAGTLDEGPNVTLHACQQLTPELAEHLAQVSTVVFIDACVDHPPGEITCRLLTALAVVAPDHSMSPADLLGLTQQVYGRCPKAYVFTVGGKCFDVGEGLSRTVADAMPRLLTRVLEVIYHA